MHLRGGGRWPLMTVGRAGAPYSTRPSAWCSRWAPRWEHISSHPWFACMLLAALSWQWARRKREYFWCSTSGMQTPVG